MSDKDNVLPFAPKKAANDEEQSPMMVLMCDNCDGCEFYLTPNGPVCCDCHDLLDVEDEE